MHRNILEKLIAWKSSCNRKPLLLSGAIQTGKTYIVREFGKEYFEDVIEINFERNDEFKNIFNGWSLEPKQIMANIENCFGRRIFPEKTLLFFDEIQSCPYILNVWIMN